MCGFSFSQSTFRFPPFNQGYRVRICHPIYLYSLFPMMNYLGLFWWRTAAGAGVAVGTPLSFCSYLLHVWGGIKPLTSGEALGWLSAGAPQTGGVGGGPIAEIPNLPGWCCCSSAAFTAGGGFCIRRLFMHQPSPPTFQLNPEDFGDIMAQLCIWYYAKEKKPKNPTVEIFQS